MNEIGAGWFLFFIAFFMDRIDFTRVLEAAAADRGCKVFDLSFDDDDNVFEVTLDKEGESVSLMDCEYVHRALLAAFDRNIEDYSLTVSSRGISGAEADELLKTIEKD